MFPAVWLSYQFYNPNPSKKLVGDCTVRAISKILDQSWIETYQGLCQRGLEMNDMPSANAVWGSYLRSRGFRRYAVSGSCPDCYNIRDFCIEYPKGTFVLATGTHVVAVEDGVYYDSWDSGNESPIYYWRKV